MEAKDLRIGNILQEKKYKTPQRINEFFGLFTVEVDSPYFDYETDDCHTPCLGNLEPIPLTEEWLLKFGFVNNKGVFRNAYYMFLERWFISHKKKYDVDFYSLIIHEDFITHIKNVHSLQNLYFALTGEELTIKK